MTTTLSGNLNFSGNAPSWANDGDEADFNVQESGHISLSISINNGVVTGTATASNIAYNGSTPDDKDGDNDAFSVSGLSGTGTVSGTTSNVVATIGLRNGTAGVVLRGSLNSAGTQFTGNAQVFDNTGIIDGSNFNSNLPITLQTSAPLFTTGADIVDFNKLQPNQVASITNGADLYHSLGGTDQVWLPANGTALAPGIKWDSTHVFSVGSPNSVVLPGATVHSGPSNDLIDGAYEGNAQFGGAANQVGNVVFTNGDTVEYTGSFKDYTITELTGGYLEVRDNRGIDGTDILKDVAFLKFAGDGTTIPAPGRELETVSDASARSWLASATGARKLTKVQAEVQAEALSLIDLGKNTRWAADPGTNNYTITWSVVTDPSKLPADYLRNSGFGVSSLTPLTPAAHGAIAQIFAEIRKFLPNVTFQEVKENSSANSQASALGLGDVGTIRFMGFGAITQGVTHPSGEAWEPSSGVASLSMQGDIVLTQNFLSVRNAFKSGQRGYVVLEHEIGHALGLGDQGVSPNAKTIMDAADSTVHDYTPADKLALQALYGAAGTTDIASPRSGAGVPPQDSSTSSNDTPLLYDSHSALFRQAMASFGTSTAHGAFHELATSDTHTLALTPAAASADTILAVSHHG
jgi:hypothetical protein